MAPIQGAFLTTKDKNRPFKIEPLEDRRLLSASSGYLIDFSNVNTPYPVGSLARDTTGNLYGVTTQAGNSAGLGAVYKLSIAANNYFNFSVLANFTAATGGAPAGGLYVDPAGNLFGTTTTDAVGSNGTIFEIDTAGAYTTLASFNSATTGATPTGSLVADSSGNLFGQAAAGGANGDGTIFELPKTGSGFGTLRAVASFNGADNSKTRTGLTIGSDGTLYGVGQFANDVYKAGPSDSYVIHSIATVTSPSTVPFLDGSGNLYGGTSGGAIYKINLSTNAVTTSTANGQAVEAVVVDSSGNAVFTSEAGLYEVAAGTTTATQLADGDLSAALVTDGAGNYFSVSRFGGGSGEFFEYGPSVSNIVSGLSFQAGAMYTPIDAVAGQIAPAAVVTAGDDLSQPVPNVEPICTVSIKTGPTGGVLGGTTTRTAVNGVATFSDLTFSLPGDYEIIVTDANGDAGFNALYHVTAGSGGGGGGTTTGGAITPSVTSSTIPASVVAGAKLHGAVKVLLTDVSASAAVKGKTTVAIYASTTGLIDGSAKLINSVTIKSLSLKASGSKSATVPVKSLPGTLVDGTYSLIAQVTDPSGATSTSTAGNAVTVAAPFVSLSVSVSVATARNVALVPGKPTPLIITLRNAGNIDAVGAATITLGISADGVVTTIGSPLSKHLKVKANKKLIVHATLKTPKDQTGAVLSPVVTVALAGEVVSSLAVGY